MSLAISAGDTFPRPAGVRAACTLPARCARLAVFDSPLDVLFSLRVREHTGLTAVTNDTYWFA